MRCPHCGEEINRFTLRIERHEFSMQLDKIRYKAKGQEPLPRPVVKSKIRQVAPPTIIYMEPINASKTVLPKDSNLN